MKMFFGLQSIIYIFLGVGFMFYNDAILDSVCSHLVGLKKILWFETRNLMFIFLCLGIIFYVCSMEFEK